MPEHAFFPTRISGKTGSDKTRILAYFTQCHANRTVGLCLFNVYKSLKVFYKNFGIRCELKLHLNEIPSNIGETIFIFF